MIISKNILTLKNYSRSRSCARIPRTPLYIIENQYQRYFLEILKIGAKYKGIFFAIGMLIFQFYLYDFNYAEYIAL